MFKPNQHDFFGWTPLHAACAGFNLSIIKTLIEKKEDPTLADKRGNCPLQLLLKWNSMVEDDGIADYKFTVKAMLHAKQDKYGRKIVNKVYPNGDTCLHTAGKNAFKNWYNVEFKYNGDVFSKTS